MQKVYLRAFSSQHTYRGVKTAGWGRVKMKALMLSQQTPQLTYLSGTLELKWLEAKRIEQSLDSSYPGEGS